MKMAFHCYFLKKEQDKKQCANLAELSEGEKIQWFPFYTFKYDIKCYWYMLSSPDLVRRQIFWSRIDHLSWNKQRETVLFDWIFSFVYHHVHEYLKTLWHGTKLVGVRLYIWLIAHSIPTLLTDSSPFDSD